VSQNKVKVISRPNPFKLDYVLVEERDEGLSVDQLIGQLIEDGHAKKMPRENFTATLCGEPVEQDKWPLIVPTAGEELAIVATLTGGSGDRNKDIVRTIGALAAMGTGAFGASALAKGLFNLEKGSNWLRLVGTVGGIAGKALAGGLISGRNKQETEGEVAWQLLNTNKAVPYAPIRKIYGQKIVSPDRVCSMIYGDVFEVLYIVGMGRLDISKIEFGRGPEAIDIQDLVDEAVDAGHDYAALEVCEGVPTDTRTVFPPLMKRYTENLTLTDGTYSTHQTLADGTRRIFVEIQCPDGLTGLFHDSSEEGGDADYYDSGRVDINIQYRTSDPVGSWTSLISPVAMTVRDRQPFSRVVKANFPAAGHYDIRVKSTLQNSTTGEVKWSTVEAYNYSADPIRAENVASIGLRIPIDYITDPSAVMNLTCEVQAYIDDWNGSAWVSTKGANNPASVYRDVFHSTFGVTRLTSADVDDTALQAWHGKCASNSFTFDYTFENHLVIPEALELICAAGRASWNMADSKHSVVIAEYKTNPVMHVSERMTKNFTGTKLFVGDRVPHGIKVRYYDWGLDDTIQDRKVFRDGYNEFGTDGCTAASIYEVVEALYCNNEDFADKIGWLALNSALHLDEEFAFAMYLERMVLKRGDMFTHSHPVPMIGLPAARIKSLTITGGDTLTHIELDTVIEVGNSVHWIVAQNIQDDGGEGDIVQMGTSGEFAFQVSAGEHSTFELTTPVVSTANHPSVGDTVYLRYSGTDPAEYVVTSIRPDTDLGAQITCIPNKAEVFAPGTKIPYSSNMTIPYDHVRQAPMAPSVWKTVSDETVIFRADDGSLTCRIACMLNWDQTIGPNDMGQMRPIPQKMQIQYRHHDISGDPWKDVEVAQVGLMPQVIYIHPVLQGVAYDVRFRTVGLTHLTSAWVYVLDHEVVGKSTAPPAPTNARVESGVLRWGYANPPLDFKGFQVFMHRGSKSTPTIADAGLIHSGPMPHGYSLPPLSSGTRTLFVRAADTSGNTSSAVSVAIESIMDEVENKDTALSINVETLIGTHPFAVGYAGNALAVLTNGTVDYGNKDMKADADGDGWKEMIYELKYTKLLDNWLSSQSLGIDAGQNLDYLVQMLPTITAESWRIEIKYTDSDDAFGSDDGWLPLHGEIQMTGTLEDGTADDFRIRIITEAQESGSQPKITGLLADLGYPMIKERHLNQYIGTSPVNRTFTYSKSYDVIVQITPTIVTSSTGLTIKEIVRNATGVQFGLFDSAGSFVTGYFDWLVEGYNKFSVS